MSGPHIKIKSDLSTDKFRDTLKHLWSEVPAIDDMPYCYTKTVAQVALFKEIRERLFESLKTRDPKKTLGYRTYITSKIPQLKPSLSREFESHLSIKQSLTEFFLSLFDFRLLNLIVVWLYHHYRQATLLLHFGVASSALKCLEYRDVTAAPKEALHRVMS